MKAPARKGDSYTLIEPYENIVTVPHQLIAELNRQPNFLYKAKKSDNEFILIDKTNHHLFQPLLYQVATAVLSPADIAVPIRNLFNNDKFYQY